MKPIKIIGGKVITRDGHENITVVIANGKIDYVGSQPIEMPEDTTTIDAKGAWISAGFIDLHTHGAGGADFMDGTVEAYESALKMHAAHGTTLLYPTTLSSTTESLYLAIEQYRKAKQANIEGAAMGGLHLEGPYFAYEQRGAQDERHLRNPQKQEYMALLEAGKGDIARWSLAPELDGAAEMATELRKAGILMAMGHTAATFEECQKAHRAGFTHMTHFYSCMSTITRRNAYRYAGVIEYGYYNDDITIEIIGDGIHVPAPLLNLVYKIKGAENIALITDSMRAAGMPDGKYLLGSMEQGQEVVVEDGVAKLLDRSAFAGSVATMDRVVRTVRDLTQRPLPEIIRSATETPARIMGLANRKGSIEKGYDADIVIFDDDINVRTTIVDSKIVYNNNI